MLDCAIGAAHGTYFKLGADYCSMTSLELAIEPGL